jgi:hypothetical protein
MANVAPGSYAISAKTIVQPNSVATGDGTYRVFCTLDAGGGVTDLAEESRSEHIPTLGMHVTQTFAATGSIVLRCRSTEASQARNSKIVAIKVDSSTRTAVTG